MIIHIAYAVCDGCGARVESDNAPDTWRTVQMGGQDEGMYCSAGCVALPKQTPEQVVAGIAAGLGLSVRDVELLEALSGGASDSMIANRMSSSTQNVKNRNGNIYRVLGVDGRVGAILVAGHLGLIDLAAIGAQVRRDTRLMENAYESTP